MKKFKLLLAGLAISVFFIACKKDDHSSKAAGFIYTLSNKPDGNSVLTFTRNSRGSLVPSHAFSTGGKGTGSALGSQGALMLSADHHWLLAVNAGSDDISAFKITENALILTSTISSGGATPISITNYKNLVYVLNAGGNGSIAGFYLLPDGSLTAIPNSTRQLAGEVTGPAQVAFTDNGAALVITEKAANKIITYNMNSMGLPGTVHQINSASPTPFGFAVGKQGTIFVSEATQGALSVYHINNNAVASLVDGPIFTHQNAACWVVLTDNNKYAYVANAASNSISGYRVDVSGHVTLLNADGITGQTGNGSKPIEEALSNNSKFLYVLNSGNQTIRAFAVNSDGSLQLIGDTGGLPTGAAGLAAE